MKYRNIQREEELKNKIGYDYFDAYDCTKIIGNIDFCVAPKKQQELQLEDREAQFIFWAEAKKGSSDIYKSMVQLILTIGKARTFDKYLPPKLLGAFDAQKIAFIDYKDIHYIFYLNDFNWTVTPSNHETKEFQMVYDKVKSIIDKGTRLFDYEKDHKELRKFITDNFIVNKKILAKTKVDKNNFMVIYNKWLQSVKPTIAVDWSLAKSRNIVDCDFYLADLLSSQNTTLKEIFVVLKETKYELDKHHDLYGAWTSSSVTFNDGQVAHTQFWNKYERPPKKEYWDYMTDRRQLLVPQDVRERKGSFFTPQIWVELSQKYLTDVLGENWQDEYYVWDCAAGTGNLLNGLTNKYNIWASTLDKQDVSIMHDRIANGANLLKNHVFQFDFLNDDFSKLPQELQKIIQDPEKRKKLVIYINPPYAEATTATTVTGTGENKKGVATNHSTSAYYNTFIGNASNEIFALFMARIYEKMPSVTLCQFSTLKFIQGSNFRKFKEWFKADYLSGFVVPASTFDNVKGNFPIGFTIWHLKGENKIPNISCAVYEKKSDYRGLKTFYGDLPQSINKWLVNFYHSNYNSAIGVLSTRGNDFQNQKYIYLATNIDNTVHDTKVKINQTNLIPISIYLAVRQVIEANWLNDRDQFLYPNDAWQTDIEFQNDCLTYTLFHGQNKISAKHGTNHWIPFTEQEVNAQEKFESNFMSQFINGTLPQTSDLLGSQVQGTSKLVFSPEATAVFDAGRELWRYYHAQTNCQVNASLYDIREHFQGRNDKGKMNNKSTDEIYMNLIGNLRLALKHLAHKIEPKVFDYGFLLRDE
jgi:ribosomal protein S18